MRKIIVIWSIKDYYRFMDDDLLNYTDILELISTYAEKHHEDGRRVVYDTYKLYKTAFLESRVKLVTINDSDKDPIDSNLSVNRETVKELMDKVMLQLEHDNKVILSRGFNGVISSYRWI